LLDAQKAAKVLGRVGPPPPVAPNPAQTIHNSLTWAWWILEVIPHRSYDPMTGKVRWGLPLGRSRVIPAGSLFHQSAVEKKKVDPKYKPGNLPEGWEQCIEPDDACLFE
jgi:hypothetical protein